MRRAVLCVALTVFVLVAGSVRGASACVVGPKRTAITDVRVVTSSPLQLTLIFNDYTTFLAGFGDSCGVGFRVDSALIASVDTMRIVETGTDTPVAAAGTGWAPSGALAAAIELLEPAAAGTQWEAFEVTLPGATTSDVAADIQVNVTAQPGATAGQILEAYSGPPSVKERFRLFGDETNGAGAPLATQETFSDVAGLPNADTGTKCKRAVAKELNKFVKAKTKALQKCEEGKVKDKHTDICPDGGAPVGSPGRKAADKIAKAATKLDEKIAKACGGDDKACGGVLLNETGGALAGFGFECPNFESGSCDNDIDVLTCDGIATCLQCVADDAVDQAIALYYASLVDTDPDLEKDLNKCQQAIGKETAKYLQAKEKILLKCWDKRLKGDHSDDCPDFLADPATQKEAFKAASKIAKAESKKISAICKKCGGDDKECDDAVDVVNPGVPTLGGSSGGDDFTPGAIGFPATCPDVTVPPGPSRPALPCARPISTLADLVFCVDCVTEFKVDCVDPLRVPSIATYPDAQCTSSKTVFLSSTSSNGDLNGLAGADLTCQTLANNAGLSGTYLAWLSDSGDSPSTRFTQSTGPYVLVDGTVIADDWTDLTDGTLQAPIDIDENGANLVNRFTWTNTLTDGTAENSFGNPLFDSCDDWTTNVLLFSGHEGDGDEMNSDWTDLAGQSACNSGALHLYCFEQ